MFFQVQCIAAKRLVTSNLGKAWYCRGSDASHIHSSFACQFLWLSGFLTSKFLTLQTPGVIRLPCSFNLCLGIFTAMHCKAFIGVWCWGNYCHLPHPAHEALSSVARALWRDRTQSFRFYMIYNIFNIIFLPVLGSVATQILVEAIHERPLFFFAGNIRQQKLKFSGYFLEVVSCVPNFEWKTETACNSTFKDSRAFKDCRHHVRPSWTRSSAVCLMACQRLGLRSLESWFGWSGNHGGKTQHQQGLDNDGML